MPKIKDLSFGEDVRGDHALFIEARHFKNDWELDNTTKEYLKRTITDATFFRVINNGVQHSGHGWVEPNGEIVQWG